MATATITKPKNGTPVESDVPATSDLQAIGEARLAEVSASLLKHCHDLNEARYGIREDIRTIRRENLYVYARPADGTEYANWKEFVTDVLGDHLKDWSDRARKAFIVMLVDEGFDAKEAATVTGEKNPEKAGPAAVTEAAKAAAGDTTPVEQPAPVTPEQKADKVAEQTVAQNKRAKDVLYDMSTDSLLSLKISVDGLQKQVDAMIHVRTDGTEQPAA